MFSMLNCLEQMTHIDFLSFAKDIPDLFSQGHPYNDSYGKLYPEISFVYVL